MPRINGQNLTRGKITSTLWFGLLTGPLAALLMEQLEYMIVPIACARRPNLVWPTLLHVVPAFLIMVTAAAGVVAARYLQTTHNNHDPSVSDIGDTHSDDIGYADGRIHFMAQLGVWLSLFGILVLIAEWIAVFVLHPCMAI